MRRPRRDNALLRPISCILPEHRILQGPHSHRHMCPQGICEKRLVSVPLETHGPRMTTTTSSP